MTFIFTMLVAPFLAAGYAAWRRRQGPARRYWMEAAIALAATCVLAVSVRTLVWHGSDASGFGASGNYLWPWFPLALLVIVVMSWVIARWLPPVSTLLAGLAALVLMQLGAWIS